MSNRVLSHAGQQQVSCLISVYSGLISSTRLPWSIRLNRTRKRTLKNGENLQIWRVFQYGKYQSSILIERITEFQFQLMPQRKRKVRDKNGKHFEQSEQAVLHILFTHLHTLTPQPILYLKLLAHFNYATIFQTKDTPSLYFSWPQCVWPILKKNDYPSLCFCAI